MKRRNFLTKLAAVSAIIPLTNDILKSKTTKIEAQNVEDNYHSPGMHCPAGYICYEDGNCFPIKSHVPSK